MLAVEEFQNQQTKNMGSGQAMIFGSFATGNNTTPATTGAGAGSMALG